MIRPLFCCLLAFAPASFAFTSSASAPSDTPSLESKAAPGDAPRPWKVEGIGEDFVPKTLNSHMVDEWVRISDAESFFTARALARREGLLVGGSSGTAVAAALRYARRLGADQLVVALCADTGRNYMSKFFDDGWMAGRVDDRQRAHDVEQQRLVAGLRDARGEVDGSRGLADAPLLIRDGVNGPHCAEAIDGRGQTPVSRAVACAPFRHGAGSAAVWGRS